MLKPAAWHISQLPRFTPLENTIGQGISGGAVLQSRALSARRHASRRQKSTALLLILTSFPTYCPLSILQSHGVGNRRFYKNWN